MVYLRAGSERCTLRRHPERVLRAKRRDAARVVPVENLVKLGSQRTNLLGYYQGYFHCFLSGVRRFSSDDSGCPYVVFYLTRLGYQALPREVLFHAGFRANATFVVADATGIAKEVPSRTPSPLRLRRVECSEDLSPGCGIEPDPGVTGRHHPIQLTVKLAR